MRTRYLIGICLLISALVSCSPFSPFPTPTPPAMATTSEIILTSTPFPTIAPTATATPLMARTLAIPTLTTVAVQPIIPTVPTSVLQTQNTCSAASCVKSDAENLRLRAAPNLEAEILGVLNADTALTLHQRNADQTWLYVTTQDNQTGWVAAEYVETTVSLGTLPIAVITPPSVAALAVDAGPETYISGINEMTHSIYTRGQSMGNRPNVFSKVGDSLTVATWVMYPLGWGQQQLGPYTDFLPVITYFSSATARDNNSFANTSLTADNGWTTTHVLNVNGANPTLCQYGESPLECEYRIVKPSIAIILIGTNDAADLSIDEYRFNMQRIIEISIARGVIPVLTTLPPRSGFDEKIADMNRTLTTFSEQFGVPLLDYAAAMSTLPGSGISADGVHPSWPPGDGNWASAVDFRGPNLQYGYTLRNLTVLHALEAIWEQVIQ